jgi:hypothetical protein
MQFADDIRIGTVHAFNLIGRKPFASSAQIQMQRVIKVYKNKADAQSLS